MLPTGSESETERDGFLSSRAEVHAVGTGAFFGVAYLLTEEPLVVLAFVGVLVGLERLKSNHLRDAAKEAAYSGGAFVATIVTSTLANGFF